MRAWETIRKWGAWRVTVDKLTHLVWAGEYSRCLRQASALLAQRKEHSPAQIARIYTAICRSKLELRDPFGAVRAGEAAVAAAEEAGCPDVLGSALVDLAVALSAVRRYDDALEAFQRYLEGLPTYTAARCREGQALQHMAATQHRAGRPAEAILTYERARDWFLHYGDERSAAEVGRSLVRIDLEQGDPEAAEPLLRAGDRHVEAHPDDRTFLADHLLDRALYHQVTGNSERAAQEAFHSLAIAEGDLLRQCRAQLLLSQIALARGRPHEALSFSLAARVSAIDGRAYDLEFEASELLFRLLREHGMGLLRQVEADFCRQGVDIYHYLSERAVNRALRAN